MKYANIREEELKNKVAHDYFVKFDSTKIIGNIDFCISVPDSGAQVPLFEKRELSLCEVKAFLWAEAKKGKTDIIKSLVQLILTIGKARTFDEYLPPAFLGVFDAEKIAFIPYSEVHDVFYVNDFNWNITPSNHETKEFQQVYEKVKNTFENNSQLFTFGSDDTEIKLFVKKNFIIGKSDTSKIRIDKNNFIAIYNKWLNEVKPTIFVDWEIAKKKSIIDGDFYLADLLSINNESIKDKLSILLKSNHYILKEKGDELGQFFRNILFTDDQKAHTQFWNKYERPPHEMYWNYIVERRDLLVPQDVRERKGSFFTPQIWVELSQKYLADVLGEDWQEEYYVWDCAAGTGNLLAGLTNPYNIWASTLDQQDVEVMHDRIKNGANLLEEHVFQFDFLNDDFAKLPKSLRDIISDSEKRKKLVVYINPPYAEATDGVGKGGSKIDVSKETETYKKFGEVLKQAKNEIFAQFLMRIYCEISGCWLANFSTLKVLQSINFCKFLNTFIAKLQKMFIVPADTFDNVKGQFPIGFMVWNTGKKEKFKRFVADVFGEDGNFLNHKSIFACSKNAYINNWIKKQNFDDTVSLGYLVYLGNDFQHAGEVRISSTKPTSHISTISLNTKNLIATSVYCAVRKCISATWLNDRDQFLYPNDGWKEDAEFQSDCLTYTLFSNNIQSQYGVNHWIPFTEKDVSARDKFASSFMTDFITGKSKQDKQQKSSSKTKTPTAPLQFSAEAKAVFAAGKALWCYYHAQKNCNVNASFYDIREHFQGRNAKGTMNARSDDETYTALISDLRTQLKLLAEKIAPKVYEYGFLKR